MLSMPEQPDVTTPKSRWRSPTSPALWIIAVALAVIALELVRDGRTQPAFNTAMAQPSTGAGARGVFAFAGQMTKNTYGLYMVDVDSMTMWAYEYHPGKECLRLVASRSWRYDRYLESYNNCDLPPEAVEQMIEQQRQYERQEHEVP